MSAAVERSLAEQLALDPALRAEFLATLTDAEAAAIEYEWPFWARPKQLEPSDRAWVYWLILAGRGFGKTRCGAEWVIRRAMANPRERIALVGSTIPDTRDVMVEGESGILAISPPWFRPTYKKSLRRLTWPNGARATTFTADEPDQLRGPQHTAAWGDEVAKWRYADAFDQLAMGLRIGDNPQAVFTTTPKPIPLLKELIARSQLNPACVKPSVYVTKGTTYENTTNLNKTFFDTVITKYEGTRLGRQELEADMLDDAPGALWKREKDLDQHRVSAFPELVKLVVAVDPSVSSDSPNAETGIVAAGLGADGHGYVLADGSLEQPTPEEWGQAAVALYNLHDADKLVGEVNNGGDLVESNVHAIDKNVPFKQVRASRGKAVRAEPIANFYTQGRVHHVGTFAALEDQMCQWEPGVSTWSPNRMDALVWALTELMLGPAPVTDLSMPRGRGGRGWASRQ